MSSSSSLHEFDNGDPLFRNLTRRQALWLGYLIGPLLVAVTALALMQLQLALGYWEHLSYVRPYGIIFLFPILLAALIGGRGPGVLALILSEVILAMVLNGPSQPDFRHTPRDWAEVTILPFAGTVVIMGFQALRNNTRLLMVSMAAEARTRAVIGTAPVGVAVIGPSGEIQFANREIERIWGQDLTGRRAQILAQARFFTGSGRPLAHDDLPMGRVLRGVAISEAREAIIELPGGARSWVELRANIVQDEKRRSLGALIIAADISERKEAEIKLRSRMEREAVMNRIAVAIRNADAPESVQQTAAASLGAALVADRCYFVNIDQFDNKVIIARDFHRPGLQSVAGSHPLTAFSNDLLAASAARVCVQITDINDSSVLSAHTVEYMRGIQVRSLLAVPIFDDEAVVALLIASMADAPRIWTEEEITLAEIVAAQTRSAAESARLHLKEHRIATILQEALRPSLPDSVPGLDVASYYRAALEEASIGGDFLDVFCVDTGESPTRSAILIGDVSGKGLAAATQVATVRMMLRYALTRGDDMARAMEHLNDTLSTRNWLIGFATLFVGVYDSVTSELRYVSCGHEPAMLRRARSGEIEELSSTGAAMGAYEGATYEMRRTRLEPGDQVLLYTDGVSDLGPDRHHALGPSGIAAMFLKVPLDITAGEVMAHVCGEMERYSTSASRDDICMLAAVVTPPGDPAKESAAARMINAA